MEQTDAQRQALKAAWEACSSQETFAPGQGGPLLPAAIAPELIRDLYGSYPLLPIEFFKDRPQELEARIPVEKIFLSSGTSARDRSRSAFSKEGLELYRQYSLQAFTAMLKAYFPKPAAGWSLIPNPSEWPTSSLAQMIAWIGEIYPLQYWDGEGEGPREAVWLFATGFHIVAFADSGKRCRLPPGSIVIETGGTKGKTRSVTREETYALIEDCFGVPKNRIVSEYGMCELASQAYDFLDQPEQGEMPLHKRVFRFPHWVKTRVLHPDQSIHHEGRGSLIVEDKLRCDAPWPIRTEDQVRLRADGAFQLEGRVAFSPLKGCSMLAEDLLDSRQKPVSPWVQGSAAFKLPDAETLLRSAQDLHQRLALMIADPAWERLVIRELGSERLGRWMLEDFQASLPRSPEEWVQAAKNACRWGSVRRWIFIPPRTHGFAILQALFIAALLQLDVKLRLGKGEALLQHIRQALAGYWDFACLEPGWRLPEAPEADAILVFGSDATIQSLQAASSVPIHGFGSWLSVSLIHASQWADERWLKDAFSLGQQGCMSSRALFVWSAAPKWSRPLSSDLGALDFEQSLQLAHSELALAAQAYKIIPRTHPAQGVLGWKLWTPEAPLDELLSPRPLTLPILLTEADAPLELLTWLQKQANLKLLSCDALTRTMIPPDFPAEVSDLGSANRPRWDGKHGGEALLSWKRKEA